MNLFDRIILTIYMLAMAFIALCVMVLPFNIIPSYIFDEIKNQLFTNWYYSLLGLLLFIVSLRLLISGIILDNKAKKGIIKPAEFGDIKISVETFESLAFRVVKQLPGIKDVKVKIIILNGELVVNTRLLVLPDINIPGIVNEVQGKIKNQIESITEVSVKEVRVSVDNIASTSAARVD